MGAGIPWFRGSDEEYKTAEINSRRKLDAISKLTGAAGTLMGQMRQSREDEIKTGLEDEKLQATLGQQARKVEQQTEPTPAADTAPQPGAASGAAGPVDTALAPTDQDPNAAAAKPGFFSGLVGAAKENGMRGLRVLGGMTGVSSPYTPDTERNLHSIAKLQGQLAHEDRGVKRIQSLQGVVGYAEDPGEAVARVAEGGYGDLRGLKWQQHTGAGLGGMYNENYIRALADQGVPWAVKWMNGKDEDRTRHEDPGALPVVYDSEKAVYDEYAKRAQAEHPDHLLTKAEIRSMVDMDAVRAEATRRKGLQKTKEQMDREIAEGISGDLGEVNTTSGASTTSTTRPPIKIAAPKGPVTPETKRALAEGLARQVASKEITKQQAVDAMKDFIATGGQ